MSASSLSGGTAGTAANSLTFGERALQSASGYVAQDVVGKALGQKEHFSWASLVASSVAGGVAGEFGPTQAQVAGGQQFGSAASIGFSSLVEGSVRREVSEALGDHHVSSWESIAENAVGTAAGSYAGMAFPKSYAYDIASERELQERNAAAQNSSIMQIPNSDLEAAVGRPGAYSLASTAQAGLSATGYNDQVSRDPSSMNGAVSLAGITVEASTASSIFDWRSLTVISRAASSTLNFRSGSSHRPGVTNFGLGTSADYSLASIAGYARNTPFTNPGAYSVIGRSTTPAGLALPQSIIDPYGRPFLGYVDPGYGLTSEVRVYDGRTNALSPLSDSNKTVLDTFFDGVNNTLPQSVVIDDHGVQSAGLLKDGVPTYPASIVTPVDTDESWDSGAPTLLERGRDSIVRGLASTAGVVTGLPGSVISNVVGLFKNTGRLLENQASFLAYATTGNPDYKEGSQAYWAMIKAGASIVRDPGAALHQLGTSYLSDIKAAWNRAGSSDIGEHFYGWYDLSAKVGDGAQLLLPVAGELKEGSILADSVTPRSAADGQAARHVAGFEDVPNSGPTIIVARDAVDLSEFERLNVEDVDAGRERPGEAGAAVELQNYLGGTLERADAGMQGDFFFTSGANTGKTVDFMLTPDNFGQAAKINQFFEKNASGFSNTLDMHLNKADFVPMDTRFLTQPNQQILDGIINRLPQEQQSKIILFK
ncbi:hypothetical protein KPL74_09085 [Bacillus sp. NP157]|nr:hypothetical protein KPL74_09085 [Bacillus sp. NP157]